MDNILWSFSIPLIDEKSIEEVENQFTVKLPEKLKKIIKQNNAAYPSKSICNIPGIGNTDFKMLLSFNKGDDESIYDILEYFIQKYHRRIIPFATDSGSGYFCIKDNYIAYVSENILSPIPLAENIDSFFALLS